MAMNLQPSQSNSAVRRTPKPKVRNYCQDLVELGIGEETANKNGIGIRISEEDFGKLNIPEADKSTGKTGIFKTEYFSETYEDFVGHKVYVMYRGSNPKQVKDVLTSIGLPSPKQARIQVKEADEDYPDYD
jgi:hypothetical protein